jgi:hypothetical protein
MSECPTCGSTITGRNAAEVWDEHKRNVTRFKAADAVAEGMWAAADALEYIVAPRTQRLPDDCCIGLSDRIILDRYEARRLQDALAVFRKAKEAFKAAGPPSP